MKRNDKIKQLHTQGLSYQEIGKKYELSPERIRQIVLGLTYLSLNTQKRKEWKVQRRLKLRIKALKKYSGGQPKCRCCGEKESIFLCIDHINGGGSKHRRKLKYASLSEWLYKNNYPRGFQILCYNCNNAKIRGICPHKK